MDLPAVRRLLVSTLVLALGCSDDNAGTAAPELVKVILRSPAGDVDLLAPPDGGVGTVPATSLIRLVFNQLLDGDKIENVLDGGGFQGKTDVVTLSWTGTPAIGASATYDPSGALGVSIPGPSITVQPDPGLPAGAKVEITLARDKITSKKGTPFTGSDKHSFQTEPFAATASVMDGDTIAPGTPIRLTFTNAPAEAIAAAVTVTPAGSATAVAIDAKPDDMDHTVVVVTAKDGGMWNVGDYTITVGKDAADLFGVKLAEAVMLKFSVSETGDGGAPPDGGASPDGGADGPIDAAPDAAVEGGVDGAVDGSWDGSPDAGDSASPDGADASGG